MSLELKSRKLIRLVGLLLAGLLAGVILFWTLVGTIWLQWDYQLLDVLYRQALKWGYTSKPSSQIVYLTITDDTYATFGKNILDRADLARVNDVLGQYSPQAAAYDIIFARPSTAEADHRFAESLARLGSAYLPIGMAYGSVARPFVWAEGAAYERLRTDYLKRLRERGAPQPFTATKALMQIDAVATAALNSGHIGIASAADGTYRHIAMLVKVDSLYFPSLALSLFLDYVEVPFDEVTVEWGHQIVIPALPNSLLEQEVLIPIDRHGQAFIPYTTTWERDFDKMAAHTLLEYHADQNLQGNLADFFEGKFVFIADTSTGISDLGQTPFEDNVPLVAIHTSVLNGLLTRAFYTQWSFWPIIGFICLCSLLLGLAVLPRASWVLHATGSLALLGIIGFAWFEFIHFSLFPLFTVGGSFVGIWVGLIVGLELVISKEQAFVRGAFRKYVPDSVVSELLLHPELLQLGGEERVLSVLFSDIEGFTTIAESMSPSDLVDLLNEYLSEMTAIILAQGGIIDKFEGDAIMAEFGAPLILPNHADRAVQAGLAMQRRLTELRRAWVQRGLPAVRCRVGINTGPMLVGNMGSSQVFDYTVIGDAVNLASRLEAANKLYDTYLMISESTHNQLSPELFRTRILDVIQVKGKSQAVKVFEVYGDQTAAVSPEDAAYYEVYEQAFYAYLSRNFAAAKTSFTQALSLRPDDPASQAIMERMGDLTAQLLPDDWDGSIALTTK